MSPSITTYSGRRLNPLDLKVEDICIEDIIHHLSGINRFVGALRIPVSVAQHSYYVCHLVTGSGWEREALFHDATEAYLGDVSKWVKQSPEMSFFRAAEERAWRVICKALDLRYEGAPEHNCIVEEADRLMVRYEAFVLANNSDMFTRVTHPLPTVGEIERVGFWQPWDWNVSKVMFQYKAKVLGFQL